jgi:ATP-dependent 26S proteasome regulatory subunit
MDITKEHLARHSEQEFVNKFSMYVDSGAGLIHVRANETLRATLAVRKAVITDGGEYREWDIVNGFRQFTAENLYNHGVTGDDTIDLSAAFSQPLTALREGASSNTVRYFVFINPHCFMDNNPHIAQLLLMYSQMLPASNVCVILVTPDHPLPESLGQSILSLRFAPPGLGELKESLESILGSVKDDFEQGATLTQEETERVCYLGAGMTKQQFETFASLSVVEAGRQGKVKLEVEDLITGVNTGKMDVVNSSDILELYPSADINSVGGMENLKDWIRKRRRCYGDEARDFGVEPPKGMVFVGPPGTGKSLAAKAVASVLGVPLVRLDFGRVFNSLVGASESRMRSALRMVESMSPCVLFCDEIDKGLGGISSGSSGDSGVSMRVLGSFLTWLQDSKFPVFTMVTANNIDGLPPELLRRGRFDAIFSTNMPTPVERREVLRIHLEARNRKIQDFPKDEVDKVIDASNKYVPAEIESAVKDGLIDAFDEGEEFTMEHVKMALARMVPLSKAFAAQIEKMSKWASENATPASASEDQKAKVVATSRNRVRISGRRRT